MASYNPQKKAPRMGNLVDLQGTATEKEASSQAGSFLVDLNEPAATTMQPQVAATVPAAKAATEEEKEKFSIYLPLHLAKSMRRVYGNTRKKFSHIVEDALTQMFYQHYQCHNPSCCASFTLSDPNLAPTRCPVCGCGEIQAKELDA